MPRQWSLVNTDAMDWLRSLPSEHADCVCSDPPYGIDYHAFGAKSSGIRHQASGSAPVPSAQCPVPPGRFDRVLNDDAPFIWWLREAWRVTVPGGCLLCFAGWQTSDIFRTAIGWAGWKVRSMAVWDKGSPALGDFKQDFGPQHEIIWFAVKGRYCFPRATRSGDPSWQRPRSVIQCKRPREGRTHPTEKPVELLRQLIRSTVPRGGLVLDPFSGTGSTGVAALTEGRRFAGSELNPSYCTVAQSRLRATVRDQ